MSEHTAEIAVLGSSESAPRHAAAWRNIICIFLFEVAWGLSQGIAYRDTVMSRYLDYLGMPSRVVAMIPVIFAIGLCVVQPISAVRFGDAAGRVRRVAVMYFLNGLALSLMGLTVFLPASVGPSWHAAAFLAIFAVNISAMGFAEPHYVAVVYHTAPPQARARVFATCLAMVGVGGVAGGWIARAAMQRVETPAVFGLLPLAGGVVLMLGVAITLMYDESRLNCPVTPPSTLTSLLRRLTPQLLRTPGFIPYAIANAGLWILVAAPAFLTNYIKDTLPSEAEAFIGELTIVGFVVMAVGSLAGGWIADRIGYRQFVTAGLIALGLTYAALATVPLGKPLAMFLFAIASLSWTVLIVGNTPLLCAIVPEVRVAEATAVAAVLTCLPRIAVPIGLGWLRDATGSYAPLFWGLAVMSAVSAMMAWKSRRGSSDAGHAMSSR